MTGDRPLRVEDRRRVTRAGQRRALRRAARNTRCPDCRKSYALVAQGGHLGICLGCAARVDLRPEFTLRPAPDWSLRRPPYWSCAVHPVLLAP